MKINKDQVILSRLKKFKFEYKRSLGHFFPYLANRFRWYYYPRLQFISKFPDHVDIELSSVCNMQCPMCFTTTGDYQTHIKQGFMDFNLFKKIIDECAQCRTYSVRISLRGESFIHKDVVDMIKYAKEKGIKEVSSLTNGLDITPVKFIEIMNAGLDWLTISFDGLEETYEKIRQPAKFEESYAKIKEYKRIKEKTHSFKPLLKVQTIWPAIKDNAEEYFKAFEPYVDDIAINPLLDYHQEEKEEDILYLDKFVCPVLYQRIVIGSDGVVLLCINDELCMYPIGDAKKESLYQIWHGKRISEARQIHKRYQGVKEMAPCKRCWMPRKTQPTIVHIGTKKVVIDQYIYNEGQATQLKL